MSGVLFVAAVVVGFVTVTHMKPDHLTPPIYIGFGFTALLLILSVIVYVVRHEEWPE